MSFYGNLTKPISLEESFNICIQEFQEFANITSIDEMKEYSKIIPGKIHKAIENFKKVLKKIARWIKEKASVLLKTLSDNISRIKADIFDTFTKEGVYSYYRIDKAKFVKLIDKVNSIDIEEHAKNVKIDEKNEYYDPLQCTPKDFTKHFKEDINDYKKYLNGLDGAIKSCERAIDRLYDERRAIRYNDPYGFGQAMFGSPEEISNKMESINTLANHLKNCYTVLNWAIIHNSKEFIRIFNNKNSDGIDIDALKKDLDNMKDE